MNHEKWKMTNSRIIVPSYIIQKPKRPLAFDFFCGAGGMGCGIIQAGFEIVGANEFDALAAITYMVNLGHYPMTIHYLDGESDKQKLDNAIAKTWGLEKGDYKDGLTPESLRKICGGEILPQKIGMAGSGWIKSTGFPGVRNFWFGDMHKLKGKDILNILGLNQGDLDMVCGGPPCQGFSRAGKQEVTDPRNTLIYEYARLIVELQPKTFVMEEVPDVLNFYDPDGVPVLDKFCLILQEGGYGKWDMIKKTLEAQANSAAVIKDQLKRHTKAKPPKREIRKEHVKPVKSEPAVQLGLPFVEEATA